MNIIQSIISIIYPELCFSCRELTISDQPLCLRCLATIKPIASRLFPLKGNQVLTVHAVGAYQDALHKLVTAKFRRSLPGAQAIGRLMVRLMPPEILDVDYVVPVPLHWWRYANRGYNQAVEMAKVISDELKIPYGPLLYRHRFTQFQYLLSRKERQENMHQVFSLRPAASSISPGARILLVDDLCTTGSTLQAAANTLLTLKPAQISAAVCARALS